MSRQVTIYVHETGWKSKRIVSKEFIQGEDEAMPEYEERIVKGLVQLLSIVEWPELAALHQDET